MKIKHYKRLACVLCAVLLFAVFAPQILAANGPLQENYDGWYLAYVEMMQLDEKGEALHYDEEGFPIPDMLFENNVASPGLEGAVYDLATNTLTLTDFKGDYTWLTTNAMGDDFTIAVHGNSSLNGITVWGWGYGSGLHIEGDGTLTVNGIKKADYAIEFVPEDTTPQLSFGKNVNVNLYGTEGTVLAWGANANPDKGLITTANGQTFTVVTEKAVREIQPSLIGYSNIMSWNISLGASATDTDPNHLYELQAGTRTWDDGRKEDYVELSRYIYVPGHDVYVKDYAWANSQGGDAGTISFDSLEDAEKAGYTRQLNEYGNPIWEEIPYCGNHGSELLYEDAKGTRYAVILAYLDGKLDRYAATYEPLEEPADEYLFTIVPDIPVSSLTEIKETVIYDDVVDLTVPQKELIYKGAAEPQHLLGDVDGNGAIEAADARLALRAAVGLENYAAGSAEFVAADVDKSQTIEAGDARLILRAAVGLEALS